MNMIERRLEMQARNDLRSRIPKPSGYYLEKARMIEKRVNGERKLHDLGHMYIAENYSPYNK